MIGVIADDLSGAAEIGAVGLRYGLTAEIVVAGEPSGKADLVCFDTDSRSCSAEEAARRTAAAAKLLRDCDASWIYKKVDSVLRGNVLAEMQAIMIVLEVERALLAPANPSRGRIIRRGRYYVQGKPIQQSEFASDPEYPRTSSKVMELLDSANPESITVARLKDVFPARGIVVAEASKSSDVEGWAKKRLPRTMLAGAAEFFAAILMAQGCRLIDPPGEKLDSLVEGKELFVCGTASKSTRSFLKNARAHRTPVLSLPSELVWGAEFQDVAREAVTRRAVAAFESASRVILNIGLPNMRGPKAAQILTGHLVQLAESVLQQVKVNQVYAEGGATAAALVRRMGWERLTVLRELAPGVACLGVDGNKSVRLTIKPGSYIWPSEIRQRPTLTAAVAA